jgi:excisionase family DNA binding protein
MSHWLTIAEAAKQSGYNAEYLRRLIRNGRIKGRKVATVWLVQQSSLLRHQRTHRKEKRSR